MWRGKAKLRFEGKLPTDTTRPEYRARNNRERFCNVDRRSKAANWLRISKKNCNFHFQRHLGFHFHEMAAMKFREISRPIHRGITQQEVRLHTTLIWSWQAWFRTAPRSWLGCAYITLTLVKKSLVLKISLFRRIWLKSKEIPGFVTATKLPTAATDSHRPHFLTVRWELEPKTVNDFEL